MSKEDQNKLQDPFLTQLRVEKMPVSIYLVNGIKLQGQIESFDQYTILLRNTVTQMVYKHAVSTIVPSRMMAFTSHENVKGFMDPGFDKEVSTFPPVDIKT